MLYGDVQVPLFGTQLEKTQGNGAVLQDRSDDARTTPGRHTPPPAPDITAS